MSNLIKKISRPAVLLIVIWFLLVLANYRAGTFLSGWDNLHPEFNFGANFERSFFSSWQEYQGLGLLGGMGHGASFIREIIFFVLSIFLPDSFLRYCFHFLMLLFGSLGVYFLLKRVFSQNFISFSGALFYLFNLATLQTFYAPFEPFSSHFGFLPWLILANLNYLEKGERKNLFLLFLVNLAAVSQGYVLTIFFIYLLALAIVSIGYWFSNRNTAVLKRIFLSGLLVFLTNAFWLLPNMYFVVTGARVAVEAKNNQMSTENTFLKNKKYGSLKEVALLRGFWFDNVEMNKEKVNDYMMEGWVDYFKNPLVLGAGYLLFGLCLLGVFVSVKEKNKKLLIFLPVLFLGFTVLANDAPVFSFLAGLFYKLPLFKQIFRFPFTKFSILTAFCLSLFYAASLAFLASKAKTNILRKALIAFFIFLPILYLHPIFPGRLFYSKERAKIPTEYFQLFDFFKTQEPNSRIANFPQPGYWGWTFYNWNYSGSGFLWYGIKQPILDRAFDVWGASNENYYWEVSNALYSRNKDLFEKVLEKYQADWVLIDENVINTSGFRGLGIDEIDEIIRGSEKFDLEASFGKIRVYRFNHNIPAKDFVFLAENLPVIGPDYQWGNLDKAFLDHGHYVYDPNYLLLATSYYPFRSLFTGRSPDELDFEIKEDQKNYFFETTLPEGVADYDLVLPDYNGEELVWLNPDDLSEAEYLIPEAIKDGRRLLVKFPKVGGYLSGQVVPEEGRIKLAAVNCNQFSPGKVQTDLMGEYFRLSSLDATNCSAAFAFDNLLHRFGYLIRVESRNLSGKSLLFWLENLTVQKADMELYLPESAGVSYLIQPPMSQNGLGYSLHFDNISIGRQKTVNDLGKVSINLLPYQFLTGLKLQPKEKNYSAVSRLSAPSAVSHPNPSLYKIQPGEIADKTTLVLSQSYHPGWKAYQAKGELGWLGKALIPWRVEEIKEHKLVNNWSNGWSLKPAAAGNEPLTIYLIFWPQYLQYLGFGLLGGTFIFLVWLGLKKRFSLFGP